MDKEKQIEEMFFDVVKAFNYARDFCANQGGCDICENRKYGKNCDFLSMSEHLYTAGYRKASDVAREIFEEIEENLNNLIRYYKEKRKYVTEIEYSEFEQRYCDIKIRTFEERLLKIAELKKKYKSEDFIPAPPHTCQVEIPKYYESIINQVFPENEDTE